MSSVLERWFYHVPYTPKRRAKPMRVLCLGFSRSGTESLRRALELLGYDHVYHGYDVPGMSSGFCMETWAKLLRTKFNGDSSRKASTPLITAAQFDEILGHCEAVTDAPCTIFARELIAAYPDAKVILNVRGTEDWYTSYWQTFGRWYTGWVGFKARVRSFFAAELYWLDHGRHYMHDKYFYGSFEKNGRWVYEQHASIIRGSVEKGHLLEWSVDDGWEPLCHFLDRPLPRDEEFPNGNPSAEFAGRVASLTKKWNDRADRNMALVAAGLLLFISVFIFARV